MAKWIRPSETWKGGIYANSEGTRATPPRVPPGQLTDDRATKRRGLTDTGVGRDPSGGRNGGGAAVFSVLPHAPDDVEGITAYLLNVQPEDVVLGG